MFARSLILALSLAAPAAAYTKKDREDAIKWITEEKGFPHLAAFDKMTPKMLKTVMTNYLNLVSPDALEFLTPLDLEVIWTATSAANNCEICLSFHAGAASDRARMRERANMVMVGACVRDCVHARAVATRDCAIFRRADHRDQCTQVISRAAAADPCVRNVANDARTRTTDSCNVRASVLAESGKPGLT